MATHFDTCPTEGSDYVLSATLVGPDGETPVEPSNVSEILATLRNKSTDPETVVFTNRNVTANLAAGGSFQMPLSATDLSGEEDGEQFQLHLLTLKVTHSNGKKRNQEFTFNLDELQDV